LLTASEATLRAIILFDLVSPPDIRHFLDPTRVQACLIGVMLIEEFKLRLFGEPSWGLIERLRLQCTDVIDRLTTLELPLEVMREAQTLLNKRVLDQRADFPVIIATLDRAADEIVGIVSDMVAEASSQRDEPFEPILGACGC
jgi:hypothetical protein